MATTFFLTTQSVALPYDWDPAHNHVDLIGSGAAGQARQSTSAGGIGGGGGAFTRQSNVGLTQGTVVYTVPAANAGTATSLVKAGDSVNITANSATASSPTGGSAGAGNTVNSAGGTGATPSAVVSGGGGGGAGGPSGAGSNGGTTTASLGPGGNADGGTVSAPAGAGNGNAGTELDGTHGCGTGATGQNGAGFSGGLYGGGGSGHGSTSTGTSGCVGSAGIIVITWTPRPNLPLQNAASSNPILWVDRPRQLPRVPDPPIPNLLETTLAPFPPGNSVGMDIREQNYVFRRGPPPADVGPPNLLTSTLGVIPIFRAPYYTRYVPRYRLPENDQPLGTAPYLFPLILAPALYVDSDAFFTQAITGEQFPFGSVDWPNPPAPRQVRDWVPPVSPPILGAQAQNLSPTLFVDTDTFFGPSIIGQPFPFGVADWSGPPRARAIVADIGFGSSEALLAPSGLPPGQAVLSDPPRARPIILSETPLGSRLPLVAPAQDLDPALYLDTETFFGPGVVGQPFPFGAVGWEAVPRPPPRFTDLLLGTRLPLLTQDVDPSLFADTDVFFTPIVSGQPFPFGLPVWSDPQKPPPRFPDLALGARLPLFAPTQDIDPALYVDTDAFFTPSITGQPFPFGLPIWSDPQKPVPRFPDLVLGTRLPGNSTQDIDPSLYVDADAFFSPAITGEQFPFGSVDWPNLPRVWRIAEFAPSNLLISTLARPFPWTPAPWPGPLRSPRIIDASPLGTPFPIFIGEQAQNLSPSLFVDTDTFFTQSVVGQPFPFGTADWFIWARPRLTTELIVSQALPLVAPAGNLSPALYIDSDAFFSPLISGQPFPFGPVAWPDPAPPRQVRDLLASLSLPAAAPSQDVDPLLFVDADTFFSPTVSGQPFPFGVTEWFNLPRARLTTELIVSQSLPLVSPAGDLDPALYVDTDAFFTPTLSGQPFPFAPVLWPEPPRSVVVQDIVFSNLLGTTLGVTLVPRAPYFTPSMRVRVYPDLTQGSPLTLTAPPVGELSPTLYVDVETFFTPAITQPFPFGVVDWSTPVPVSRTTEWLVSQPLPLVAPASDLDPDLYVDTDSFFETTITGQPFPFGATLWPDPPASKIRADDFVFQNLLTTTLGFTLVQRAPYFTPQLLRPVFPDLVVGSPPVLLQPIGALSPALYVDADAFFAPSITGQPFPFEAAAWPDPPVRRRAVDFLTGSPRPLLVPRAAFLPQAVYLTNPTPPPRAPELRLGSPLPVLDTQFLIVAQYVDNDAFFTPVISATANIAPPLYVDADILFGPVISSAFNVSPPLYVDTESFFSPTITSSLDVDPALYIDVDTFFTPAVTAGSVDLRPSLYVDLDVFFTPNIAQFVISPPFFVDVDVFYSPDVERLINRTNLVVMASRPAPFSAPPEYSTRFPILSPQDNPTIYAEFDFSGALNTVAGEYIKSFAVSGVPQSTVVTLVAGTDGSPDTMVLVELVAPPLSDNTILVLTCTVETTFTQRFGVTRELDIPPG